MMQLREIERRWVRFKRFGEARVLQLHALERTAGLTECPESMALARRFDFELGPYWHEKKSQTDQSRELEAFVAHARKLVIPIYHQAQTTKASAGDALQAADLSIVRDTYRLNYGPGSPLLSSPILRQVYGGQDYASGDANQQELE